MAIVQADSHAMSIIECNEEAMSYLANIPSEYQEVEYIESSWSQVIKSGVYLTKTGFRANIDFQITSSNPNDQAIFGCYFDGVSSGHYRTWYGQNEWFTLSVGVTSLSRQTATGNNTTYANSSYQFYIFAKQRYANGNYDSNAKAKLYSCQIYDWNTLVRDFYACYRKSDNVIGLFDRVNKVFYTNQWSWSFTKWPDYKR